MNGIQLTGIRVVGDKPPSPNDIQELSEKAPIPKERTRRTSTAKVFWSYRAFWGSLMPEEKELLKRKYRRLQAPIPFSYAEDPPTISVKIDLSALSL